MIEDYLLDTYNSDEEDHWSVDEGVYHASDVSKCPRKTFFKHKVGPEDNDAGSCKNFERGNMVEDFAEKVLRHEFGYRHVGNAISVNVGFDDFELVGETDPVIFGENGAIDKLFEVKSKNPFNFKYVKDEPQLSHVYQTHVYMQGLGLDEADIWYVQIPDFDDVVHTVEFDDEVWGDIVERLFTIHECIERGVRPDRDPFASWECKKEYCPYYGRCHGEKEVECFV